MRRKCSVLAAVLYSLAAASFDEHIVDARNCVLFEDVERAVGNRCAAVEVF